MTQPIGFWSYARRDDDQDGQRLTRLADQLRNEYSLITGDELTLFVDRESLEWGQQWRERLDNALQETTFFIPLISPRFFQSQECRQELLKFAGHAKSLGVEELLLPILYVDVEDLSSDSGDEAVALVARTQYADWRHLRLVDESSEQYRQEVNKLAVRLRDVARQTASRAVVAPAATPFSDEDDEAPGLIDLVADFQPKMDTWQQTIVSFTPVMEQIGTLTNDAAHKIERGDAEGKPFGYRITVARQLAHELDEPAETMLRLGERYASQLADADPSVLALIRMAVDAKDDPESMPAICELFASIRGLISNAREALASVERLTNVLAETAALSRDLRPAVKTIRAGLRGVLDGRAIMEEWGDQIQRSGVECPET